MLQPGKDLPLLHEPDLEGETRSALPQQLAHAWPRRELAGKR
jgi:hypothetical protein